MQFNQAFLNSTLPARIILAVAISLPLSCFANLNLQKASAQKNWPQLLGPNSNNHATTKKLPIEFNDTKNVTWKTKIHDRGWSSPVIWENQIWMGTATKDGTHFYAICVDKNSGKVIHDIKLFDEEKPRFCHSMNSYASPTPTIEAGRVYIHFGSYGTACIETDSGKVVWKRRDLPCNHFRGPGSSPILFEDLLIVHFDGFDVQYVVALNKETGKTVWRKDRDVDYKTDNGDIMKAYCTPLIIEVDGQKQLISPTSKATIAYDPKTGKEIWRLRYNEFSATARPVLSKKHLFINSGFGKAQLFKVRLGGSGDITDSHVEWKIKKGVGSKPTPILAKGNLYLVNDRAIFSCVNADTGEYRYSVRVDGQYSATPLYADGKIYLCSHEGTVTVVEADNEYKKLAVNKFPDGFMSSPAVSDDALFLRSKSHLYRIEKK